jgi:hypothetical protein
MNQPLIGWANRHHDVFLFGRFAAVGEKMMYSPQGHRYTGALGDDHVKRSPPPFHQHLLNVEIPVTQPMKVAARRHEPWLYAMLPWNSRPVWRRVGYTTAHDARAYSTWRPTYVTRAACGLHGVALTWRYP